MINIHRLNQKLIWDKAARFLVGELEENLKKGKKILLLLSGGSAVNIYTGIQNSEFRIRKEKIAVGQLDERYIKYQRSLPRRQAGKVKNTYEKLNTNEINAEAIRQTGLWEWCEKMKIPFFTISQDGSLEESATDYNRVMESLFSQYDYKIAVLGIGEDGHTAGLLPGYEKEWNMEKFVVGYTNAGKFAKRISLTPWTLRQIDQAVIVINGKNKGKALRLVLDRKNRGNLDKFPAVILQETKRVDIFQG